MQKSCSVRNGSSIQTNTLKLRKEYTRSLKNHDPIKSMLQTPRASVMLGSHMITENLPSAILSVFYISKSFGITSHTSKGSNLQRDYIINKVSQLSTENCWCRCSPLCLNILNHITV